MLPTLQGWATPAFGSGQRAGRELNFHSQPVVGHDFVSLRFHDSPRQRIHYNIHTESGIINTVKSLVSKIIVPLAAIVLVTV